MLAELSAIRRHNRLADLARTLLQPQFGSGAPEQTRFTPATLKMSTEPIGLIISEQHVKASKLDETDEVPNVVFPAGDEAAKFCIQANSR